jgi:hypothetical protein
MKSVSSDRPGDVVPRQISSHLFYPLATVKCVGPTAYRSQHARDFACLLDVDPDIAEWSCMPPALHHGGHTYATDFLATSKSGRTFLIEVGRDLPDPPDGTSEAAAALGYEYRPVAMGEFITSYRLRNAKDLLRYGFYRATLGDRVRLLAALDENGSLTVAESLAAFREGRPMTGFAAMILQGFIEVDLDAALISPESVVRRIQQ